jgi:hypothetical protein
MEKSDEVILAGPLDNQTLVSPSGESSATYYEVRVIRTWKGSHQAGDMLTFGVPGGDLWCDPPGSNRSWFAGLPAGNDWGFPFTGPTLYVLFLRHPAGDESKAVQGLRLAAGEGFQGMFLIKVPTPKDIDEEEYCARVPLGQVQHCASYLKTSKSPVMDPYARDPLAKTYVGMPASGFLKEVQRLAGGNSSQLAAQP